MKPRIQFKSLIAGLLLGIAAVAFAQGAKESMPVDFPPSQLKAGEFIWAPEAVPSGPLVMVISLDEQLAYVYRNGLRIGVSTVSTGKKGYETPTGVFTILQKQKVHFSSSVRRCADALHAAPHLGRRRLACRPPARLSGLAWLHPPAL